MHAVDANAQPGLRRTNAAKRRAVQTLLNDAEFKDPGWSPITWITVGDLIGEKLPDSPDDMKPALIVDTESAQML